MIQILMGYLIILPYPIKRQPNVNFGKIVTKHCLFVSENEINQPILPL